MSLRTFHHRRKERTRIDYSTCAIPKIARVVNPAALEEIRAIGKCEYCGVVCRKPRPHPHHIKSVGSGGGDVAENLVGLCVKDHRNAHAGLISKALLRAIAAERIWKARCPDIK